LALFPGFRRELVAPAAVVFFTLLFEAFFRAPVFFLDDWVFACERFLVALRLADFFAAAMAVSRLALGLRAECRKLSQHREDKIRCVRAVTDARGFYPRP
jgi:hypothetical protein